MGKSGDEHSAEGCLFVDTARLVVYAGVICLLLVGTVSPGPLAAGDETWRIAKIFYGSGWLVDPVTRVRQLVTFLNLSQSYEKAFPGTGTFDAFSQLFIEFSIPANASGPANGSALTIRFSYYSLLRCIHLDNVTCPLGSNDTAINQDVFQLELRRILEYRDTDGSGAYEPADEVVGGMSLAQPESPHVRAWPFAKNGSAMDLPYNWSISTNDTNLRTGALFAGDPLLEELSNFWISAGNGVPTNLTLNSFLFLQPTTYKSVPLTPTMLKLDIYLGHILYAAADTAPALEFALTSTQFRLVANETGSNHGLFTNSSAARAFFTWNTTAAADGKAARVRGTIQASNESTTVYLSYPRANSILHDPVLGFTFGSPAEGTPRSQRPSPVGDPVPWIPTLLVAGGLVAGVAIYAVLRRRPR